MADKKKIVNAVVTILNSLDNEWINVKDRLPEMYEDVLIVGKEEGEEEYYNEIAERIEGLDGYWFWSIGDGQLTIGPEEVLAWMPIPKYEEGGSNDLQ